MNRKSITFNAIMNILLTVSNLLFPLISFPYVTRVLSVMALGKVNFFNTVGSYAVMLATLGMGTYGIRACAKNRDDTKKLSQTVQELLVIRIISTIVVMFGLVILYFFVAKFNQNFSLFIIQCCYLITSICSFEWLFSGLEQYSYITKRSVFFKLLSLVLLVILVKSPDDYIIYAAITVFSTSAGYLCNLLYSKKFISYKKVAKYNLRKHLKPMFLLFAANLAVSVYTSLDTVMLSFISGDKAVGYYTVAVKIKTILLSMVNAISAVLLPRLTYYISEKRVKEYNMLLKKSISIITTIALYFSVYFILEAKNSILFLSGKEYIPAVFPMQIMMPILIISGFSNITGNQILLSKGMDSFFMRAVIVGAVADVGLNILLMPKLGVIGAALATVMAEIIQMIIQVYYSKEYLLKCVDVKMLIKEIIAIIIAILFVYIYESLTTLNPIIDLLCTGIIFSIIYILMLNILRVKWILEYEKKILSKIRSKKNI